MADEKVFLDASGIRVTSARFIVNAQTFAMSGITSVKVSDEEPSRGGPIIFIVLGAALCLVRTQEAITLGILLAIIGVVWLMSQRAQYHILLTTASGEVKALTGGDRQFVYGVVDAINDSIVHRG